MYNNTDISKVTGTVEDFFRGYIEIGGETGEMPLHAYGTRSENGYVSTVDQVKDKAGFAGVLSEWAGFIEFQDRQSADIAEQMIRDAGLDLYIRKTDSGCRIGFRNTINGHSGEMSVTRCHTKVLLACGLIANIKIGPNSLDSLKIKGVEQALVYPLEADGTPVDLLEYDSLPAFFRPVGEVPAGWHSEEGDGYKSALIGLEDEVRYHFLRELYKTMRCRKVSVDDCRVGADMCNAYVFGKSFSDAELQEKGWYAYVTKLSPKGGATQESADAEPTRPAWQDEKGKLVNLNRLGDYIRDEKQLVLIGNAVHTADEYGIYRNKPKMIRRRALELQADITVQQRDNLEKHLLDACEDVERSDCRYIAFKNGVLDIETGNFREGMPEAAKGLVLTTIIPWDYKADAPAVKDVDGFLDRVTCGDKGIRDAIEQMWGAELYDCTTGGQMFFLSGKGGSGKTTIERGTKEFLGRENVCSRSLKELSQPFVAYEMLNKKAVIGDDISDDYLSGVEESNIKKFFGGFAFNADRKFKESIEVDNFATAMYSCNAMPTFSDRDSGAIDRRVVIIPFDAQFRPDTDGYDPRLSDKLITQEAMEYICRLAVEGLKRYIANGLYLDVESARMDEVREAWLGEQQPLRGWWENAQSYCAYRPVQRLLDDANEYLESFGRMKITDKALTKFVKSQGYVSKLVHWRNATYMWKNEKVLYGDKSVTIYVPKDDNSDLPPAGTERPATGYVKDEQGYDVPATAEDVPF